MLVLEHVLLKIISRFFFFLQDIKKDKKRENISNIYLG